MKLTSFRTFLAFVCSIGLISYVVAGPGQSGDHGRPSDVGSSGPGFNQSSNPGQQGQTASDGTRFDSSDNPGKSGSGWGRDTAANGAANGRDESVSDTGDRGVGEEASSEKSENSESDHTFKASLMDTGLDQAGSPSAHGTPGQ